MSINDYQPISNSPTSEIEKDYECIFECLTALAPLVQAFSIPAPSIPVPSEPAPLIQTPIAEEAFPVQVPPVQAFSALALSTANEPSRKQDEKHLKQVHIASPSDTCFLVDKCTNNDADSRLSQYPASR